MWDHLSRWSTLTGVTGRTEYRSSVQYPAHKYHVADTGHGVACEQAFCLEPVHSLTLVHLCTNRPLVSVQVC